MTYSPKIKSSRCFNHLPLIVLIGAVLIAGCREPSGPTSSGTTGSTTSQKPPFDFQQLVGQWQGRAYQNDLGVFLPSKPMSFDPKTRTYPKEVEAKATMDFVVEVDEKYLQFKGVEACYIRLIYKPAEGSESRSRKMYRMKVKDDVVTFEGMGGTFELESCKVDAIQLKGQFRDVGGELMRNSFQVKLFRIDTESFSQEAYEPKTSLPDDAVDH